MHKKTYALPVKWAVRVAAPPTSLQNLQNKYTPVSHVGFALAARPGLAFPTLDVFLMAPTYAESNKLYGTFNLRAMGL